MPAYATDTLDLSRIQVADIIPALSFEELRARFIGAFLAYWGTLREKNPALPEFDLATLESDPANVIGEAGSYLARWSAPRSTSGCARSCSSRRPVRRST